MKHLELILLSGVVLAGSAAVAEMKDPPKQSAAAATGPATQAASNDRGQQVFNENCSRCHNSPEGFSPHISGTVARHMRVRANLSDADYRALLKFLNP